MKGVIWKAAAGALPPCLCMRHSRSQTACNNADCKYSLDVRRSYSLNVVVGRYLAIETVEECVSFVITKTLKHFIFIFIDLGQWKAISDCCKIYNMLGKYLQFLC